MGKKKIMIDESTMMNDIASMKETTMKNDNFMVNEDTMLEDKNMQGEEQGMCPCCSGKQKVRDDKEYKDLMNRLKRIEGQVRGVEGMLEKDAYCTDIIMQVSAITSALNSFNKALLANHVKTCVADNIRQGNDEVIDELVGVMQKLMK